ncbi:MAG: hypothetical protein CVU41_03430 [Chloroflexi bacterium HGW-Chloroflexi-3]|nr:MAG: hypothetical protein CVU41_03430 [Chloroflexi bacterium HGW-Chloroflexi-3]
MPEIKGRVEALFITPKGENISKPIEGGIFTNEGLIGDRHFGVTMLSNSRTPEFQRGAIIRNRRQVSLVSQDELDATAKELDIDEIKPEWLAANLLISGIPHFSQLPVGARLFFDGGLVLFNDGENFPCKIPAKTVQNQYKHKEGIQEKFIKAAMHRRGLVAWVEHPSQLISPSTFEVELPPVWKNLWG